MRFKEHALKGKKQTPEQIAKRVASIAKTKANWSEERLKLFKQRVSESNKASDPEVRKKMSEAHKGQAFLKGRKFPERCGENHPMYGKHHTDEAIEKMRKVTKVIKVKKQSDGNHPLKGRKFPERCGENHHMYGKHHTNEAIEKMRKAASGKKQSPEHKQKKIDARSGYRHSEETRAKIKESNQSTWSRSEIRDKVTGENNPCWLGGVSFGEYGPNFNKALKKAIRARDNQTCKICGAKGNIVHHIDYKKSNNSPNNLVTVCRKCHLETHRDEEYWERYFSEKFFSGLS